MSRVRLSIPASIANLGPGFDCLALSLALYNDIELEMGARETQVEIEGEGADLLLADHSNLVLQAADRLILAAGHQPATWHLRATNRIPPGSGLGSSAAAVIGGLAGANALLGSPLGVRALLELAGQFEGHYDNAAAALLGGLVAVSGRPDGPLVRRLASPKIRVAVACPAIQLPTAMMRSELPPQVPLQNAVFNLGSALLTVEALRAGDYDLLGQAMQDRLHQANRSLHIPGIAEAEHAARASGARAVCVAGAGPALAAFAEDHIEVIAQAMQEAFARAGVEARCFALETDSAGVQLIEQAP
jgi:homoserine kinase